MLVAVAKLLWMRLGSAVHSVAAMQKLRLELESPCRQDRPKIFEMRHQAVK